LGDGEAGGAAVRAGQGVPERLEKAGARDDTRFSIDRRRVDFLAMDRVLVDPVRFDGHPVDCADADIAVKARGSR